MCVCLRVFVSVLGRENECEWGCAFASERVYKRERLKDKLDQDHERRRQCYKKYFHFVVKTCFFISKIIVL
jgi:hypothetical protein